MGNELKPCFYVCPYCQGEGQKEIGTAIDDYGNAEPVFDTCPHCNGTGKIE